MQRSIDKGIPGHSLGLYCRHGDQKFAFGTLQDVDGLDMIEEEMLCLPTDDTFSKGAVQFRRHASRHLYTITSTQTGLVVIGHALLLDEMVAPWITFWTVMDRLLILAAK